MGVRLVGQGHVLVALDINANHCHLVARTESEIHNATLLIDQSEIVTFKELGRHR